jgi:hypothetical protein
MWQRIWFAIAAFFVVLFRGRLPRGAAAFLAPDERAALTPAATGPAAALPSADAHAAPPRAAPRAAASEEVRSEGALVLLGLLQREGRLVDFLRESLDGYDDAAIGAAVRDVHRGCRKALDEHVSLEPVMPGREDDAVTVPRGFDPGEVRLIGRADGEPPFRGTLVHHGWRALGVRFPTLAEGLDRRVLAPAEVKVG